MYTEREHEQRERERGFLLSQEPNAGFHPRTWKSVPEPKADT